MKSTAARPQMLNRYALLILCLALPAAGCGVSKAKYMGMTQDRDALVLKNSGLQASLDSVNTVNATLHTQNAALESHAKEMEATSDQLATQLKEQQAQTAEVHATYESMMGRLQGELKSGQVEVQQLRDGISVNLAQDILFKSGSADLDKTGRDLLLKVADEFKASKYQVVVTGHTDDQKIGPGLASRYPTNWELGGARAARIVRLFEESGLEKGRLAAVSFADSRPREANTTPAGRAKNRRIEIRLRPTEPVATAGN
jgi:chemotaxis protein MotB